MDVELLRIRKLLPPPVGFFLLRSSMMNSIEDKAFTLKLYPTDGGTSRGMAKVKFKCGFFLHEMGTLLKFYITDSIIFYFTVVYI